MARRTLTPRKTAETRRVGISVRISKDRKNEISTDVQRKACRDYADQKGWQVVDVYEDRGRSAHKPGARRPGFERCMADIEAGAVDTLLVYRLDRLTRSAADFYANTWRRLEAVGAEFVSVNEGFDTTTAMGKAMLTVAVAFAQLESDIKSERMTDWHAERVARGALPPGFAPFGYRIKPGVGRVPSSWEIVPDEATAIRAAARSIVTGKITISGIVRDWNAKGIRSLKGGAWTRRGVRDLMMNPHLANLRRLDEDNGNGEPELIEGTWKPILTTRLYDDVLATLSDHRRRTGTAAPERRYLLTSIIRCGVCNTPMVSMGHQTGRRYACKPRVGYDACRKVSIDITKTEAFVRSAVTERFGAADLQAAYAETDPQVVVTQLEDEREDLARLYGNGDIDVAEWRAARDGLEQRLDRAREVAAEPRPVRIDLSHFDDEPIEAQRMFVNWAFEQITVAPAVVGTNRFDTDRITLTPRRAPRKQRTRTR